MKESLLESILNSRVKLEQQTSITKWCVMANGAGKTKGQRLEESNQNQIS